MYASFVDQWVGSYIFIIVMTEPIAEGRSLFGRTQSKVLPRWISMTNSNIL